MHDMTTLYDKHKAAWDKIAADGKPAIAEMAKRFHSADDMDDALGMRRATHHWIAGRNGVSGPMNKVAEMWLAANPAAPAQLADAPAAADGAVLMVVVDAAKSARVQKMLAVLGCEVVEV
jgi:hypothetical protein